MKQMDQTKEEFQIGGRTFHEPKFATEDGKAKMRVHDLPTPHTRDNCVRMMTVRSEGQFNTVVYEEYDLYRGIDARDVILLHPDDVQTFGLKDRQRVTVCSDEGKLENIEVRAWENIRAGNALMYYPEANCLVPNSTDPRSKTPCFKSVLVWIEE
jgi:anaerobic selenocysteine-containing dehydrogenase